MVYESGLTTRRTYASRPVVTSYAVSRPTIAPINWEKCPFVPRPSLISEPVTAFGRRRLQNGDSEFFVIEQSNRAVIKPCSKKLCEPIKSYVPARETNRERILSMVRQHIDNVVAGGNAAGRTYHDILHAVLPRMHHSTSEFIADRRESFRNPTSGAKTPRLDLCSSAPGTHRTHGSSEYSHSYKSSVQKNNYDSNNKYSRPERSTYESTYELSSRNGPGGYNYSTERSSNSGGGTGGYSYSSTTSGNFPGGTRYRNFSYRV